MVQAGLLLMWFSLTKNLLYNSHTICATQRIADSSKIPRLFSVFKKIVSFISTAHECIILNRSKNVGPESLMEIRFFGGK